MQYHLWWYCDTANLKFQESNLNPDRFIESMNSFDTNHIFNDDKNLCQYDQNAIPSQIIPCYSYPVSLMNKNEIPIELTCYQAHLGLIMFLMSMKMLANMVRMWYSEVMPCYSYPASLSNQFWNPYRLIMVTSWSDSIYVPNEHGDIDQYGSFAIPSDIIMLYQSHPESLVNQNGILVDSSC